MPFTVYMPKLSPTMTEGTVAKWHKRVGDRVESGDVLLEISTDKATVEHAALDEGFLRAIVGNEGDKIQVNDPICVFSETENEDITGFTPKPLGQKKEEPAAAAKVEPKPQAAVQQESTSRILASPLAKKLAKEKNLNLSTVAGSGPRGRIMSRDLETAAQPATQPAVETTVTTVASATPFTLEALTPMRQVIGTRLQESKSTIPHFYVKQEIDANPIAALREELKRLEKNVTINDFIIKALAVALKKHPEINSGFDAAKRSAMRYTRVDICVAVTVPGGLITPIVFDASKKSLSQISQEVKLLAAKARDGKLAPNEYQGGSFTLSNLGMFGIDEMSAIVNPPQGAILGVGAASDVPVVKNGQIVAGKRMSLTLSCDHRLIDGAEAAQFMRTLRELLENPILFLSE